MVVPISFRVGAALVQVRDDAGGPVNVKRIARLDTDRSAGES